MSAATFLTAAICTHLAFEQQEQKVPFFTTGKHKKIIFDMQYLSKEKNNNLNFYNKS